MSLSRGLFVRGLTAAAAATLPSRARAADELRVAFIPDVATTAASYAEKQPLVDMLQTATGRSVRLIIPTNYAATVEAIGNEGVDLAYFGALTYVKANARYGARPLVQRMEDRAFHSLFIASATNDGLKSLKDLKGKTFAFGDVNSTSGHLIAIKELGEAGLNPDTDLRTRYTGNHTATAVAVASGQVDAGALDETVYRKLVADKTLDPAKARVFYTSKPFIDYVWAVRKDLDSGLVTSIRHGFLQARDPKLLALLRATRYVTANDREYDTIRDLAKKLNLL
ncbi:MAG: putative selenate ABC transporter substrate-binding protein [Vulcanimicrobiaceae bacterium]